MIERQGTVVGTTSEAMTLTSLIRKGTMIKLSPIALLILFLCGCAPFSHSVKLGDTQEAVRGALGAPTTARSMPAGDSAWEYASGPAGRRTYIVRFNDEGKVTSAAQVLSEENFRKLPTGSSRDQVRETFGRPYYHYSVPTGDVWEYRIYDEHARAAKMAVQFGHDGGVTEVAKVLEDFLYRRFNGAIFLR
jgi:outer membrane protein assembly factor BamE (lipoprotein component of BamABCDE complex)